MEREWLATIESLPPHVQYVDAVQAATELVELLRKEKGCDLVVCLGHMRWPRNRTLLEYVACQHGSESRCLNELGQKRYRN